MLIFPAPSPNFTHVEFREPATVQVLKDQGLGAICGEEENLSGGKESQWMRKTYRLLLPARPTKRKRIAS
jgi:hypothetical protein